MAYTKTHKLKQHDIVKEIQEVNGELSEDEAGEVYRY